MALRKFILEEMNYISIWATTDITTLDQLTQPIKHTYSDPVVLEKTLESPLDCKEIQPVHPKGDQSWIFIGRTNAETEAPMAT